MVSSIQAFDTWEQEGVERRIVASKLLRKVKLWIFCQRTKLEEHFSTSTHVNDVLPQLRVDTLADIKPKTTRKCRARESRQRLQMWEETREALPWVSRSAGTGWCSDLHRLIKHGRGDLDTSSQTSSATDLSWRSPGQKNHVSRKTFFLSRCSFSQLWFSF